MRIKINLPWKPTSGWTPSPTLMSRYCRPDWVVTSSASLIVVSHAASQMSLVTSSSGREMADAGDVAMATVAAMMAREAPAMRSTTVFTMDARSTGCEGERDACVDGYRR